MAATLAQVTADALALPPEEREQLAASLRDSLPEDDDAPLSEAWIAEIKRRIEAVENGAETFDADEVIAEIKQEIAASERKIA